MSLCVAHICGPKGSGKTTLARYVAEILGVRDVYHVELIRADAAVTRDPLRLFPSGDSALLTRRFPYSPDRVFEQVPAVLQSIRRERRWATVLLETDSDPCHRQGPESDLRLFVASAPDMESDVFRSDEDAARVLNEVMNDSAAFAAEIYGLPDCPDLDNLDEDDSFIIPPADLKPGSDRDRNPMTRSQYGRLLSSDIGLEIAARVQFQPDYQLLLESDVVLINTGRGGTGDVVDTVARRVEELQLCVRRPPGRETMLAVCDLMNPTDPMQRAGLKRVAELLRQVTATWPQPSRASDAIMPAIPSDLPPPPIFRTDYPREAAG